MKYDYPYLCIRTILSYNHVKNNLKLLIRNILKHKLFTLINIMGLAIGLTSSLLIIMHVSHEYSYDTNGKKLMIFTG